MCVLEILSFKGVIGCKIHFTSCLNINVCCPYFKILFLKSGCSESSVRMTPRMSCAFSAGEDKMSQIKRFKCLVVGCNNEYSSHHLLPTSELGVDRCVFFRADTDYYRIK